MRSFFDGNYGVSARHLRSVLHRFELAFAAVRDIHLYPFERIGNCEGAFSSALHNHSWVVNGGIILAWTCCEVPTTPLNWSVVDEDDEHMEQHSLCNGVKMLGSPLAVPSVRQSCLR